jgi:hypothetical protein
MESPSSSRGTKPEVILQVEGLCTPGRTTVDRTLHTLDPITTKEGPGNYLATTVGTDEF